MKNRIVIFLALILSPAWADASKILHTTVYTDSDSTFQFMSADYVMGNWYGSPFSITTNNLVGVGPDRSLSDEILHRIQENVSPDFQLVKIDCYCDNSYHSQGIFSYQGSIAYINPAGDGSAFCSQNYYCDFYNKKIKTPVLIVPGLMGTEMKKDNELLWADIPRMVNPFNSDNFMDPLAFSGSLSPIDSGVYKDDVIRIKTVLGYVFDYTDGLINEFEGQGYVEGEMLFAFPYDWRYGVTGKFSDGRTNSDLLAEKIQSIRQQTGSNEVDVVAHSLGGLVVKKYVIDHQADNYINKVVFVGVPNTGAPKVVKALLQGDNFGVLGLSDQEMKKISENMPAAYDLLPSQQYFNAKGSFVQVVDEGDIYSWSGSLPQVTVNDLNFEQTKNFLNNEKNLNTLALTNASNLHTADFDNFDLRTAGISVYALDGCKSGTIGKVVERRFVNFLGNNVVEYNQPKMVPGDGTVPFESATNLPIDSQNKFYFLSSSHSKALSANGLRQKIVNLIFGSNLNVDGNLITQDISRCSLNGKAISVFSPVDIFVTDQQGNQLGLAEDGSVVNEIPNADFEIWGEHKFLYLPQDNGQNYNINLQGTGDGTYTIKTQDINNSQLIKTEIFENLPVTPELTGQINLGSFTTLLVKQNLNEEPIIINPSQVIDYSADETAPEAIIYFDPNLKDLKFAGVDNLSDVFGVSVADNGNTVILKDEVGNVTEMIFKERNRRTAMSAQIVSVKYNGVPVDMSKNVFSYSWLFDNFGKLAKLTQKVKSQNNYSITAIYDGVNTKLTGTTSTGKISQSFQGLKIIKVATNQGDLSWSY